MGCYDSEPVNLSQAFHFDFETLIRALEFKMERFAVFVNQVNRQALQQSRGLSYPNYSVTIKYGRLNPS